MNKSLTLLFLVLLVKSEPGFGQQRPAPSLESLVAAAQQAQVSRDYAAAVTDYQQAVRLQPDMPELWANLGLMQRQAGDSAGAILSFQHALRLNPSLYVPNLFLGVGYLRAHKAPQAIPYLLKAEKVNKTDPQAPLALGRAYVAVGKFSAAEQELTRATTIDPKLSSAWFALGIAHLDQVEADALRISEEGKQSPFAGALYAESLQKQARFGEAATLYKTLINVQPQPPCIRSDLGFALLREHDPAAAASEFAAERETHPECSLAIMGQARMAIESGDNQRAASLLKELWDRDHGFVESNASILLEGLTSEKASEVTARISDQQAAMIPSDLRDALLAAFNSAGQNSGMQAISPDATAIPASASPAAASGTAEKFYAAGEFQQCESRIAPNVAALSADKLRLLAACSFLGGDNERTARAAAALKLTQPGSLEALYWSIQANERLAFKALAQFQFLESDSVESHVLLGDIYHQLERFDDSIEEYRKALVISPDDSGALLGLASAYRGNNDMEHAMETAQTALARNPDDPELNLIVAEALLSHDFYTQAEPYLAKSLHAKPQILPHVHALMGKVYAETGRTRQAIEQLKMATSSDEDGSIQYLLSRLYREIGDKKDAAEALDRVKEIKEARRARGPKRVEDPDLSSLEYPPGEASTP